MSSKTLRATVKLDTKGAEQSLKRLESKIKAVNKAINSTSTGNNKLNTAINKAVTSTNKLDSATKKVAKTTEKVANTAKKVNDANSRAANSAYKMRNAYASSNTAASKLLRTMKGLAATYLGVMGAKAIITASDTITSSENRLNNLPGGNAELTQTSMDKMYAAAQRSRSGYGDMLSNVSKSMTLAGGSFQNNIDNAIRFQEIMSKAYTIGGASAAEQSSSMYQLIQALGSGVLQGDELRSVREGAPIAYKEIEKFAQGVLHTEESLKELASQGKITSDMVVAAIMNAEEQINKSFKNTKMTFAQSWEIIKNMALQAFRPVLQMFNELLNSKFGTAIINILGYAFVFLANTILWLGDILGAFFSWCSDNWYWLQWIVYSVVAALVVAFTIWAAKAIWAGITSFYAFITGLSPLYIWILVIGLVVAALAWLANSCSDACDFIYQVCMILANAIIALLIAVLAVYLATGTVMLSIPVLIGLCILGVLAIVLAAFVKYTAEIVGTAYGIAAVISAICDNIGIAWQNMCSGMASWFWNAIADMLDGCTWLLNGINKIREALGKSPITVDSIRQKATAASASGGQSYVNLGDAWTAGYNKGYVKGDAIHDTINGWGDKLNGLGKNFELTDVLKHGLGDKASGGSYLPGVYDPAYGLSGAYNPEDLLNGIGSDVGDIKDSMDLSNDDLEFLRKIADMEWRNEFTTAEIRVDMTNNNTVTAERDLDGIVEYLSDVLRSEMTNVAYGVHY